MSNQTFKFPGFFDREIDLTQEVQAPLGTPAGVIGMSDRGPAFVPKSVGSFPDFKSKFGDINPKFLATYAAQKHLEHRKALTFVRVLGAGANITSNHISDTLSKGIVNNAGFKITPTGKTGHVQYLLARHVVTGSEAFANAGFTHNDSLFSAGAPDEAMLVRGMIFCDSSTRIQVLDLNETLAANTNDAAGVNPSTKEFKIVVSSSNSTRTFIASLNPSSDNYFAKVLNKDPERFEVEGHLVYADFAVDAEVATVGTGSGDVVIASGSLNTSANSGDTSLTFNQAFGRFDTRFKTAKTPFIISQPFGNIEHNLFQVESLDDGAGANTRYKISIANLQRSVNPRYKYGTFSLLVRDYYDSDTDQRVLEQFNNLTLDPESENYICNVIGDKKVFYNFDAEDETDRRLVVTGKFANKSKFIRILPSETLEKGLLPPEALPFGFRGLEVPNFNPHLVDRSGSLGLVRLSSNLSGSDNTSPHILSSLVPPVPLRFKVTRGAVSTAPGGLEGAPGNLETVDARYFWGIKTERNSDILNPNPINEKNSLVDSFVKFLGIKELDVVVTGSAKDTLHNNKFTLARVAFGNGSLTDLTSSAANHMKEAAYIRNGNPDVTNYKILDTNSAERVTFATLLNKSSNAATFNAYSQYAKFTTVMQGGFDGFNILDKNSAAMNDRATSTESSIDQAGNVVYGGAHSSYVSPGLSTNVNGTGLLNNTINSYKYAVNIITDPFVSNVNILAVPGQRDPLLTNYVADKVKEYGLALYLMDIPNYNSVGDRIWDGEFGRHSDPLRTAVSFEGRTIDNDSAAVYYPDIVMDDSVNRKRVTVPGSIAAVSAISFNDKVAYPWFAPAGFNRASLDFVLMTTTKMNQAEREKLFSAKINPIVKFPREGFVIMSQNTLEQSGTALGSVNVQRMIFDLKKQIIEIGNRVVWENITPSLKADIKNKFTPVLSTLQARKGINSFVIVCDNTNNTDTDMENNKINVKIAVKPTKAVEYIAIDFIITRSGVTFQ